MNGRDDRFVRLDRVPFIQRGAIKVPIDGG